jgi:hypothetical protein
MTDPLADLAILATDDQGPHTPDDAQVNPRGGRVVALTTPPAPEYDRPFERVFLGEAPGELVAGLTQITRIAAVDDTSLLAVHIPEGVRRLERIDSVMPCVEAEA